MNGKIPVAFFQGSWDPATAATKLKTAVTRQGLADSLGISHANLTHLLWGPKHDEAYKTFQVPKKAGGHRIIEAPTGPLVALQRRIAAVLTQLYHGPSCVHGFMPRRSIVTNASCHVARSAIFNIDLKDFFHAITFPRLRGALMAAPYKLAEPVATALAQACCYKGRLPQGAPTSPMASNIVARSLDCAILEMLAHTGITYTRYADDLSFSVKEGQLPEWLVAAGPSGSVAIGKALEQIVTSNGFAPNIEKVRLRRRASRQLVTGLVVNDRVNVPRWRIRRLRATINACWRFGLQVVAERAAKASSATECTEPQAFLIRRLRGELAFLGMVRGNEDKLYLRLRAQLENVLQKENPYISSPSPNVSSPAPRRSMRILHISDIHFCESHNWDSAPILQSLVAAVGEICAKDGPPDFIACTGDIAQSGSETEYGMARRWFLESLLPAAGVDSNRLLVVPGNHDFNRRALLSSARLLRREILGNSNYDIPQMFRQQGDRDVLLAGLKNYDEFAKSVSCQSDSSGPWWSRVHEVDGRKVLFCGLCSPWLSQGDGIDKGQLLLGAYQMRSVLLSGSYDAVIGLVHHPLSYLADNDGQAKNILEAKFDILLHGHLHEASARVTYRAQGDSLVEIAAGSCYGGGDWINSFNFLEFDISERTCRVHRRLWDSGRQHWLVDYNSFQGAGYHDIMYRQPKPSPI